MAAKASFKASRRRTRKMQTNSDTEEDSVLSILVEFCSYTSWGGLDRVAESKYALIKIIWLLAFIGAFGAGIYQLVGLFYTYKGRPIATHISLEHGVVLQFPSVTVCNYNMIRKSRFKDLPHQIRQLIENYALEHNSSLLSTQDAKNTIDKSDKILPTLDMADEDYRLSERVYALLAKMNESELRPLGYQFDTLVLSCKFQGVNCRNGTNKSFWSTFWHFKYGNCFIFNPKLNGQEQKVLTTAKTGPSDGTYTTRLTRWHDMNKMANRVAAFWLILEMDVEQYEYIDQLTQNAGAIVNISPHGTMPFPFEEGVNLAPGFSTSLGIKLVQIDRLDRFNNNSCADAKTKNTFYTIKYDTLYTKRACVQSCLAYNQRKNCGCMEYKYQPNDKGVCDMFNSSTVQCLEEVIVKAKMNQLNCSVECPPSCSGLDYRLTSSFSSWPSKNYMESYLLRSNVNRSMDHLRENLVKVQIFYQDLNYELIAEKISYALVNFVSDIGGQLGLWLGVSVLSGLELVELVVLLCLHFFQKKKRKKKKEKNLKTKNHELYINNVEEKQRRYSGIEL